MNEQEFETLLEELFAAFPAVCKEIKFSSPDPSRTYAIWRSVLGDCSLGECRSILTGWLHGSIKPFEQREWDRLPWIIRSHVWFERDRLKRSHRSQAEAAKFASVKQRRSKYDSLGLEEVYEIGHRAAKLLDAGVISEDEWQEVTDDLCNQVKNGSKILIDPLTRILKGRAVGA